VTAEAGARLRFFFLVEVRADRSPTIREQMMAKTANRIVARKTGSGRMSSSGFVGPDGPDAQELGRRLRRNSRYFIFKQAAQFSQTFFHNIMATSVF
jgi:hypothetical protein